MKVQHEPLVEPKFITMKEPKVIEKFADNGEHSHWELMNSETGEITWSEEAETNDYNEGIFRGIQQCNADFKVLLDEIYKNLTDLKRINKRDVLKILSQYVNTDLGEEINPFLMDYRDYIAINKNVVPQERIKFAVNTLKQYAKETGSTVRSTSDLSPLEEWLIVKLYSQNGLKT